MNEDTAAAAGLSALLMLFNAESKKSATKLVRDIVVTSEDLFHIILAGRSDALDPYKYACHFADFKPSHLYPTSKDRLALASNGVGPLSKGAKKVVTKISQMVDERRMFAAHLFYTLDEAYWHLIYFDQRDTSSRGNHWQVGGPHIHYSRESFTNSSLRRVWHDLNQLPPKLPKSVHMRYDDTSQRGG